MNSTPGSRRHRPARAGRACVRWRARGKPRRSRMPTAASSVEPGEPAASAASVPLSACSLPAARAPGKAAAAAHAAGALHQSQSIGRACWSAWCGPARLQGAGAWNGSDRDARTPLIRACPTPRIDARWVQPRKALGAAAARGRGGRGAGPCARRGAPEVREHGGAAGDRGRLLRQVRDARRLARHAHARAQAPAPADRVQQRRLRGGQGRML